MRVLELCAATALGACAVLVAQRLMDRTVKGKIRMGYWKIRGLGAPLRMMLEYTEADYEDTQYTDGATWFKGKKPELLKTNALANLPYLEMADGTVVSEANACFMHLGECLGLTPQDKLLQNELLSLCMETRNHMTNRAYPFVGKCPDRAAFDESMAKFLEGGPFDKYEATLKMKGTPFFCGSSPSAVDFHIWEMLDQFTKVASDLGKPLPLEKTPLCAAFYAQFRALPTLQRYFASEAYALGCNAGVANWV